MDNSRLFESAHNSMGQISMMGTMIAATAGLALAAGLADQTLQIGKLQADLNASSDSAGVMTLVNMMISDNGSCTPSLKDQTFNGTFAENGSPVVLKFKNGSNFLTEGQIQGNYVVKKLRLISPGGGDQPIPVDSEEDTQIAKLHVALTKQNSSDPKDIFIKEFPIQLIAKTESGVSTILRCGQNVSRSLASSLPPDGSPTPETLDTPAYFGGMYSQFYDSTSFSVTQTYPNAVTNQANCPSGYVSQAATGNTAITAPDSYIYLCFRKANDTSSTLPNQFFSFGGFIGHAQGSIVKNIHTGTDQCPSGYDKHQIIGLVNKDFPLWYCMKPLGSVKPDGGNSYAFLGFYGSSGFWVSGVLWSRFYDNPITSGANCPANTQARNVWGYGGLDWGITECY